MLTLPSRASIVCSINMTAPGKGARLVPVVCSYSAFAASLLHSAAQDFCQFRLSISLCILFFLCPHPKVLALRSDGSVQLTGLHFHSTETCSAALWHKTYMIPKWHLLWKILPGSFFFISLSFSFLLAYPLFPCRLSPVLPSPTMLSEPLRPHPLGPFPSSLCR